MWNPSSFSAARLHRAWQPALGVLVLICATALRAEEPAGLTLSQAHELAIKNHPLISVADLRALAARQTTAQARAGLYPNLWGSVVAVGNTHDNTRLAAIGGLNNPIIFERNAEGLVLSQLLTDFGRTPNLVRSAKSHAEAEANNARATREQILLQVDAAFYGVLEAQAIERVAQQTVETRKTFYDQVSVQTSNNLKSELDADFARVNLEEGRLLLSKSKNDIQASFSQMSTLLGYTNPMTFRLIEGPMPEALSTNVEQYTVEALGHRPDLQRFERERDAALAQAKAEKAGHFPTISVQGSAGVVPIHDPELPDNYAAAGLVLNVPLFAGGYFTAKQKEAELRAAAAADSLRDAQNNVLRDVRIAWLNADNAFERLRIATRLVETSTRAFQLSRNRYDLGISSIVELNQAQLSLLSAQIAQANAQYEFLLQRSVLNYQIGALK
jgi:outer membrane protein